MLKIIEAKRRAVTEALRELQITGPEERYNLEYSTAEELEKITGIKCRFNGTHYWFNSVVRDEGFLQSFVGLSDKILDVGAGNGSLFKKLINLGVSPSQLTGVDISQKAVERCREIGVRTIHGTISEVADNGYDIIFLSYFVDRDADQRGTFEKAVKILRLGGIVVLEGLFPCSLVDSNGISYGTANVTRGDNALEDSALVIDEFKQLDMELRSRLVTKRQVYSMDGPEVLPSCFLFFKKPRRFGD